jgi:hypothetical protein
MGGPGSGNHYHWWRGCKKTVVEHCRSLDADRWTRDGILRAGVRQRGSCTWYEDEARTKPASAIGFEVDTVADPPWLRLFYTFPDTGAELDYQIDLVSTVPHFGGLRWWFVCPLGADGGNCGRRVGKLYLPPGDRWFACRHCHELTYTSCQESRRYDGLARALARNTGTDLAAARRALNRIGRRR